VIAGDRVPTKISELQTSQPALYDDLCAMEGVLERHYKDMQVCVYVCVWVMDVRGGGCGYA
jgi:hypothetical protein